MGNTPWNLFEVNQSYFEKIYRNELQVEEKLFWVIFDIKASVDTIFEVTWKFEFEILVSWQLLVKKIRVLAQLV